MSRLLHSVGLLALLACLCWPVVGMRAQDGTPEATTPEAIAPGSRHAQVIAQGVAHMPGGEVAWQVRRGEANVPAHAGPIEVPAGFLLADEGVIVVADEQGTALDRLAPGEALWTEPGEPRIVVSLDGRRDDYYTIALVPPPGDGNAGDATPNHASLAALAGRAFDVDLIRDVLQRAEETVIPGSESPMLLLVTRGKIFVDGGDGRILRLTAGESIPIEVADHVVVSGASRSPAAFVVARVGADVPRRLNPVKESAATPPAATPVGTPLASPMAMPPEPGVDGDSALVAGGEPGASLAVAIQACPFGMTAERFEPETCAAAPAGTMLSLRGAGSGVPHGVVQALPTGWAWAGLEAGANVLDVTALPVGFTTAALGTRPFGGEERGFNLFVPAGAGEITRTLYLFPPDVPRDISLTISVKACPPGMTAESLVVERCEAAPPGTTLTLSEWGAPLGVTALAADVWVWRELGPFTYALRVNAVPAGFTGYQLEGHSARADQADFAIVLGSGTPEFQRALYLFQPYATGQAEIDSDDDGLIDAREVEAGTNPFLPDADGDGILDGEEVDLYGTDPRLVDTDGDRLDDGAELLIHRTNPLTADSDGDGVTDSREIAAGSDPLDAGSLPATPAPSPTREPMPTMPLETPEASPVALPTATLVSFAATPLEKASMTATRRRPAQNGVTGPIARTGAREGAPRRIRASRTITDAG